jgi:hypothetical protein
MSSGVGLNVFVAVAAAAQAAFVVTQDRDLLALQKPLGIEIVTPAQLIHALRLWQSGVNDEDSRRPSVPGRDGNDVSRRQRLLHSP